MRKDTDNQMYGADIPEEMQNPEAPEFIHFYKQEEDPEEKREIKNLLPDGEENYAD